MNNPEKKYLNHGNESLGMFVSKLINIPKYFFSKKMATFAIIEFGFIIIGLALSWIHVRWLRNRRQKKNEIDEINERFNSIWDGSDEQELYAWYLVKNELRFGSKKPKGELLEYIDGRIRRLNTHPMKSKTFVSEDGELIGAIEERRDLF